MKKPIYIFSSGELHRKGNTLVLIKDKGKKYIPITLVSEIYILGEVSITKKLLEFLASSEILVHFFNYHGFYIGTYYPREHYNSGFMILKQAEHYLDKNKRVKLAAKFVEGAIWNMQQVLNYYAQRGRNVTQYIDELASFHQEIHTAKSVGELMGIEGNAKQSYYNAFNEIIRDKNFKFTKRTKRPPESRIDSILSFLNSLLYVSILREIYMTHLDPRIGFLHESNFRSFTLNLDVADIFKPIIVDRTMFSLINRRTLNENHFTKELKGIFLNQKGKQIAVNEFENKMKTTIKSKQTKRKASYRRLIRIELYKIEKHLIGEKEYTPFKSEW